MTRLAPPPVDTSVYDFAERQRYAQFQRDHVYEVCPCRPEDSRKGDPDCAKCIGEGGYWRQKTEADHKRADAFLSRFDAAPDPEAPR